MIRQVFLKVLLNADDDEHCLTFLGRLHQILGTTVAREWKGRDSRWYTSTGRTVLIVL